MKKTDYENTSYINIEDIIPIGRKNAVSRKYLVSITGLNDRLVRRAIENTNAIIINTGKGYFIPNFEDENDVKEFRTYINQENARIHSINNKLAKFNEIYNEHYPVENVINETATQTEIEPEELEH